MKILPISQLLVIVAAMLPGYLAAAESNDIHCSYTYNGQAMTPENILELAPKVPQDIEQKVQNFFAQKPDFAYIFSGESYYTKIPFLYFDIYKSKFYYGFELFLLFIFSYYFMHLKNILSLLLAVGRRLIHSHFPFFSLPSPPFSPLFAIVFSCSPVL